MEINLLLENSKRKMTKNKFNLTNSLNTMPYRKLANSKELLVQMLNSIPNIMIFLVDKDCRIIMGEGPEIRKDALHKNGITNKFIEEIFDKEVVEALYPLLKVSEKGTSVSHEMLIQNNYYHIQVVPIQDDELKEITAGMIIFENITERRLSAEALKIAKAKAERSNKAKSEFLANVSHEIRTPLNTVIGFTDQLAKTKLDKKQKMFLDAIRDSSNHLFSIVDETITLSQVEAGEIELEKKAFLVKDVLNDIANILGYKASKKKLELNIVCTQRLDKPLIGYLVRLKQVLLNIVNNAIKFTEEGSVTLTAEIVQEMYNEILVKFRVIDTGIGIKKSKLKSIFKEFTQADQGITRHYGGSGLGLTISKKLIELQNGRITAESQYGVGSEFIIDIPFKTAQNKKLIRKKSDIIDPEVFRERSFLLVDDDEFNRLLAATIFDEWKVEYELAENGHEALEMIDRRHFDIVLLDIHMPGMSGMEVAKRIRKTYSNRNQPVYIVAVTANVIEKDLKHFMKSGMDGYLLKPFRENELFDIIIRFLFDDTFTQESFEISEYDNDSKKPETTETDTDYDLTELKDTTKDNKAFFNTMLTTFITNTEGNLELLSQHLKNKDWINIGELAHKMLPAYKHLNIMDLVSILNQIEHLCLYEQQYDTVPRKIETLRDRTTEIINELKQEMK